ncbi:MAG: PEP-CTERM sorting domain-containing protein [Gemmataceae bacterium]
MRHRPLAALIGAALLSLPAPRAASAGPILWTYQATFGPVGGPGWLVFQTSVDPYPDGSSPALPTPSWKFDTARFGTSGVRAGSAPGVEVIGFTVPDGYGLQYDPVPAGQRSTDRFRLTFSLTDNASGRTATTSWTGTVTMHYHQGGFPGEVEPAYVFWDIGPRTQFDWKLGANTYRVALYDQLAGRDDRLFADVTLNPTPEPATLLMAGIGAGGLGALRLRRLRLV